MTKQEIYDELVTRGAALAPVESYKKPELEELLAKTQPKGNAGSGASGGDGDAGNAEAGEKSEEELAAAEAARKAKPLRFDHMGYCPALNRTYYPGSYMPKDEAERAALEPYAVKEG